MEEAIEVDEVDEVYMFAAAYTIREDLAELCYTQTFYITELCKP